MSSILTRIALLPHRSQKILHNPHTRQAVSNSRAFSRDVVFFPSRERARGDLRGCRPTLTRRDPREQKNMNKNVSQDEGLHHRVACGSKLTNRPAFHLSGIVPSNLPRNKIRTQAPSPVDPAHQLSTIPNLLRGSTAPSLRPAQLAP